jgi:GxxExxY protein
MDKQRLNALSEKIIGAAIEVHKEIGPGLLESAYQQCLAYLLSKLGLRVDTEYPVPLQFQGLQIECA